VLLALAVPATIGFSLLFAVEKNMTSKIGDLLYNSSDQSVYTRADFDNVDLKEFFADEDIKRQIPQAFSDYRNIQLGKICALVVIAVSIVYVLAVVFAGKITRKNRGLLLFFFSNGLYITAILCIIIVIINAAVLIASIYYAEVFFIQRVHVKLLLFLALAVLYGVYLIVMSIIKALKRIENYVECKNLSETQYPKIWEFVRQTAQKMNAKVPNNIIAGLEPTFYATEININASGVKLKGETLFISLTLSRILNVKEFESVIGHELAHFTAGDVKYTTKFYPVYASAGNAVGVLNESMSGSFVSFLAMLPAFTIFSFFLSEFMVSERSIGRERELAADLLSAQSNGDAYSNASALVKVLAYSSIYEETVLENLWQEVLKNTEIQNNNVSLSFMQAARRIDKEKAANNLQLGVIAHPTDTHPGLKQRIENLGFKLDDIADEVFKRDFENSASILIDNYEILETELSEEIKNKMTTYKTLNGIEIEPEKQD
jgi:Zn-dependent protease with chaperone function